MHVLLLFYLTLQQVTRLIKNFSNNKLFEFILSMILLVIFPTTDILIIDFFYCPSWEQMRRKRRKMSREFQTMRQLPNWIVYWWKKLAVLYFQRRFCFSKIDSKSYYQVWLLNYCFEEHYKLIHLVLFLHSCW